MINMTDCQKEHVAVNNIINHAIRRVLKIGWYVLGNKVSKFERVLQCARDSKQATFLETGKI
jgi:hypothetical protein